jgi:hypothetical protein
MAALDLARALNNPDRRHFIGGSDAASSWARTKKRPYVSTGVSKTRINVDKVCTYGLASPHMYPYVY